MQSDFNVGETKYIFTKFSALDGKTTACWSEADSDFQVRVTQAGVWFQGEMKIKLEDREQLENFAELISHAWTLHKRLIPKLTTHFNDKEIN